MIYPDQIYDAEKHCKLVIDLFSEGKGQAAFCSEVGITRTTFNDWQDKHAEFARAVSLAEAKSLAWWEEQGRKGVNAEKFNAGVYQIMMTNKFRYTRERTMQVKGLSKAKDANGKMKVVEKEIEAGSLTASEANALASIVATGATVNEKTSVADQVKELMSLVKK